MHGIVQELGEVEKLEVGMHYHCQICGHDYGTRLVSLHVSVSHTEGDRK